MEQSRLWSIDILGGFRYEVAILDQVGVVQYGALAYSEKGNLLSFLRNIHPLFWGGYHPLFSSRGFQYELRGILDVASAKGICGSMLGKVVIGSG